MSAPWLLRLKCAARRFSLPGLFVGQSLLKVTMFMAPGTIAFFESVGYSGWLAAFVVATELYLIVALAAGLSPPLSGPCGPHEA